MSKRDTRDAGFVSASLGAAVPDSIKSDPTPVRLSFEPFGRRRVGDPDPYAPGYQRLDGCIRHTERTVADGYEMVHYRDVSGRDFILAPGEAFRSTGEIPDGLGDEMALSDYSLVLGRERADGNGYIPVGIYPVLLLPE